MKDNLFWYKYQPKQVKNIILLPRIKELIEDGLTTNMIFYSDTPGTGKTTLARTLCKDTDNIEFNASEETSVNVLRDQLSTHCKSLNPFKKGADKTIFLDEFDGVSLEYMKAMKGFSDKHTHVRFILTTNYIEKIDSKILSRFTKVDFNPKNKEEEDYLKIMYFKYLNLISKKEKIEISESELKKIIMLSFPDLRAATQKLQEIGITKNTMQLNSMTTSKYDDIFSYVLDGENDAQKNYMFVLSNFQDNPLELMKALGRPLFSRVMEIDDPNIIKKCAGLVGLQKAYNERYTDTIDPLIHLISYMTDIKDVLNE